MANKEIRQKIKDSGLYQWQVANAIGVTEMTLIRWLRTPLTKERAERIDAAIATLKEAATHE